MAELRGLTGVKGALKCEYAQSARNAMARIRKHRAVTAAGPEGAVNIWRDDAKRLRSNFCRYHRTVNESEHEDFDCLRAWLNVWWPAMGR